MRWYIIERRAPNGMFYGLGTTYVLRSDADKALARIQALNSTNEYRVVAVHP